MDVTIYHNPKCKASCEALKHIRAKGIEPEIVDYMQDPLPRGDLVRLLNHLRLGPKDIIRTEEARSLGLNLDNKNDLTTLITAIAKHPDLMARPIVVSGTTGKVCPTPEIIDTLVGSA